MRHRGYAAIVAAIAMLTGCAALASWDGYDDGKPIAAVQAHSFADDGDASVFDTVTVKMDRPQTAGDLLVVAVGWYDTTATLKGVTDKKGNTYRLAVPAANLPGSDPVAGAIYYAAPIAAATAGENVVSVQWDQPAFDPDVRVVEYAGLDPKSPLDAVSSNTGGDDTPTTGPFQTKFARELVFASVIISGDEDVGISAAGTGFTERQLSSEGNLVEDRTVFSAGTYTASCTVEGAVPWLIQVATFH